MNKVSKYTKLISLSWQNGLVYRTSVIMWRLRQFLFTFMSLTVWTVIFSGQQEVFNYSQSSMITYIFLIGFLQSLILASALNGLASRIYSGEISNYLLKPVNIYLLLASEEVADKAKNIGFLLVETAVLFYIFLPEIILPQVGMFLIFLIWSFAGVILNFFISLVLGAIGFWSPETWGPRFLIFMILDFTAGKMFPLDILPEILQKILMLTPFPYMSFLQVQLFLGRVESSEILNLSLNLAIWVVLTGVLALFLWKKGLKDYEAVGR
jgi:ABC-2 type transport system permease protein